MEYVSVWTDKPWFSTIAIEKELALIELNGLTNTDKQSPESLSPPEKSLQSYVRNRP